MVEEVFAKRNVCHKAGLKSKSADDKYTLDVDKKEVDVGVMAVQVTIIHG